MNVETSIVSDQIFSICRRILGTTTWGRVRAAVDENLPAEDFADSLVSLTGAMGLPEYLPDLARLEWHLHCKAKDPTRPDRHVQAIGANPTLTLIPVGWSRLAAILPSGDVSVPPQKQPGHVMIWRHPETGHIHHRQAEDIDLLALKIAVERRDPKEVAVAGNVSPGDIQTAIDRAVDQGLLLRPTSAIRRTRLPPGKNSAGRDAYTSADVFTLQWHITQACDLHCRHCYDRSDRTPLPVDAALAVLEDLYDFCRQMHVRGQVTFTGGNPLLYPHLETVYKTASRLGFGIAILGNPGPLEPLRKLMQIAHPLYFQISLEGLPAHNDHIRGQGHFERSLAFLEGLRDLGIYSMVMLTLTRDNLDQVLPLAERLDGLADHFTFNRLSAVGEGAKLLMPEKDVFEAFLRDYACAAVHNPMLGLKENLLNIVRRENGEPPFGGCAGYGCGAAFNFLALLPDGEVHACRKFPSPIGNIRRARLSEIYHSQLAGDYRTGSQACRDCSLNLVCRGCMAVAHSLGLNALTDRDPFCFIPSDEKIGNRPTRS